MLNWKTLLPKKRKLRLVRSLMKERTRELTEVIKWATAMRMMDGPFKDLTLPEDAAWGDLAPKLLGTYEADLWQPIEELVRWRPAAVVNVGCAEGYYAVGLARRLPEAQVIAYDIAATAQAVCKRCAALNKVTVDVRGECTPEELARLASQPGRHAIVIDCEGYERELLLANPEPFRGSALLVEAHDTIVPAITDALAARYEPTHRVTRVVQGARNPNAIPLLKDWNEADRWLVMSERRANVMTWLWMLPKAAG